MITIQRKIHFRHGQRSRKELREGEAKESPPAGRIPRVSRLMALAIRFDQLLRDGTITDQAELARLGHVTRARLTQIMNLLNLAPDLQETIIFLPPTTHGRHPITERNLRPLTATPSWKKQRQLWQAITQETYPAQASQTQ